MLKVREPSQSIASLQDVVGAFKIVDPFDGDNKVNNLALDLTDYTEPFANPFTLPVALSAAHHFRRAF